jgi:myo-inositol-1(or 4)-monophosphatase
VAIGAARAGGAALREHWRRGSGYATKTSDTDVVLDADRASEAAIVRVLRARYPGDAIVGEEGTSVEGTSGRRWYVDPLDGTVNYLYGVPHFAVALACEDAGGLLAGVVFDPSRDELFSAGRGEGAWLGAERLRVSAQAELGHCLIATGFGYVAEHRERQARLLPAVLPLVRDIRRAGSAALDLAWVAARRLDGYFETGVQPWDVAAGTLIVREAGGVVIEVAGIGDDERRGVIASNETIAGALRATLRVR